MSKQKRFEPSMGHKVAVHFNIIGIRAVAKELDIFPETLGEALDRAGFTLVPDLLNMSSDSTGVLRLQDKAATEGLRVVKEGDNGK